MISLDMDSEVHQVHCRMNLQLPGALRKKNGWGSSSHRSRGSGSWRTVALCRRLCQANVMAMVVGCWFNVKDGIWETTWHDLKGICLDFGRWLEILDTNKPRTYTLYVHSASIISYIYIQYIYIPVVSVCHDLRIRSMHLQIEELANLGDFGMNCVSSQKASLKCRSVLKFQLLLPSSHQVGTQCHNHGAGFFVSHSSVCTSGVNAGLYRTLHVQ